MFCFESLRINTSIQLRSSLITINSHSRCLTTAEWKARKSRENSFHFKSIHFFSLSLSFELTNWVNLSIIFDLFGVLCIQTIGDYHKLCLRVESEGRKKKNFLFALHLLPIYSFLFLIKLIRTIKPCKIIVGQVNVGKFLKAFGENQGIPFYVQIKDSYRHP